MQGFVVTVANQRHDIAGNEAPFVPCLNLCFESALKKLDQLVDAPVFMTVINVDYPFEVDIIQLDEVLPIFEPEDPQVRGKELVLGLHVLELNNRVALVQPFVAMLLNPLNKF